MLYLLLACARPPALLRAGPDLAAPPAPIAVAPAALLADLPGGAPDPFYAGELAGEIWFSGGFARFAEHDNQVRSVNVDLSHQDRYADQARAWLDSAVRGALTDAGVAWQALDATPVPAIRRPLRVESRGTAPEDGSDDQHLPRFERLTRPLLRTPEEGADTAVWLVATRPESRPPHFWHDRALRPVVFPGQRPPSAEAVRRLADHVTDATGAPFVL